MESRIKECQADLFADRTPASTMRTNQLRLWFASMSYVLMCALRRIGLAGTDFAEATCGTIRLKLLKIGALVTRSVRRVKVAFASACPTRAIFAIAAHRLRWAAAWAARRARSPTAEETASITRPRGGNGDTLPKSRQTAEPDQLLSPAPQREKAGLGSVPNRDSL
jgi:hypothetical protein